MSDNRLSEMITVVKSSLGINKSTVGFGGKRSFSRLKVRRQSFGFASAQGITPVKKSSQLHAIEFKRPPLLFMNTYQIEPSSKFELWKVLPVIEKELDECFTEHKYNVQTSPMLAIRLATDIMRKIKTMAFNRYRIITIVTIGQKRQQSYSNALAFLWDHERDAYANTQREVETAFIQVTVLGVYLD